MAAPQRNFLLLQGPHGPFMRQLAARLRETGAAVWRVGFNAGDWAFWRDRDSYIPFDAPMETWADTLAQIYAQHQITDLVIYGDTRFHHRVAIDMAKDLGITVHVFEEGYVRPYWVTYERDGANGYSRINDISLEQINDVLHNSGVEASPAPDRWGDTRAHVFYGALYHWFVLFRNKRYAHFRSHRGISLFDEFLLYLRRALMMPLRGLARMAATRRIIRGGFTYHMVLLQLEHDASIRSHSPIPTMRDFIDTTIKAFQVGAPGHHHLVFKAHPLEDGRVPLRAHIVKTAREHGLEERVHFVNGGKLARLLDQAKSAVTINSTAGQQVLWRGLPLHCFGNAVYRKPGLVSQQSLPAFFADPLPPDRLAYLNLRSFLLETSQVPGSFYSARGRRRVLRHVVDAMLADSDPYQRYINQRAAQPQQFRVVEGVRVTSSG